ncbi:hypothetical protein FRC05_003815 [Tulasnella sp. 425]|nr:hypothetical protein FRC05_003815 [Tulasnella sp. 425]
MVVTRQKNLINHEQPSDETGEDEGWPVAHGSPDHEYTPKPKRKRAKTARSARVSGKSTNHLKEDRFTSLPLDVVYEILAFLAPLDLLNLARTNKALRNHLMSKRSRGAWKAARAATEPPVSICPKAMSEPQLAVLLFTKDCTVCGKPLKGSQRTWWILHLRACSPCFRSKVILGRAAVQDYEYLNLDDFNTVLELLPGEPKDVGHMSEVVEHHQLRLEARVEGSVADFEQVIETTKPEVIEQYKPADSLGLEANENQSRMAGEGREPGQS